MRFKNQGLDAVEVQDNGGGIAPHNYASLALKHYTSKLSTFDDLDTLQTFGFRGEALSSLCALSHFSVVTCLAADVPRGTKLQFETSGRLGPTGVVAAQKGTTVAVENLFWNLPVRRRELERNIKREWTRVISLLNQYACIQTGVKFTVTQQPSKGKKVVLFATKGNASTRDNIINVFGAKTMGALLALDLTLEMAVTGRSQWAKAAASSAGGEDNSAADGDVTHQVRVRGFVSRPAHGQGRQTPDRQMFYVNGRPCKLPQFAQLFGEVYRGYNSAQSPFIFADIQLDTHLYDVNVSPDKQTILLHDQGRMLDTLRESLIELFEKQDITMPISQLTSQKRTAFKRAPAAAVTGAVDVAPAASIAAGNEAVSAPELPAESPSAPAETAAANGSRAEQELEDTALPEPEDGSGHDAEPSVSPKQLQSSTTTHTTSYPGPRKRLSDETATVTVGDETISTPLLLSGSKRRNLAGVSGVNGSMMGTEKGQSSTTAKPQKKQRTKAPLPSFSGRLTQMFSATRSKPNEDDVASNPEIEEREDDSTDDSSDRGSGYQDSEMLEDDEGSGEGEEDDLDREEQSENDGEDESFRSENDRGSEKRSPMDVVIQQPEVPDAVADREVPMDDAAPGEEDGEQEGQGEDEEPAERDEGSRRPTVAAADSPQVADEDRRSRLFLKAGGSKKRYETLRLVQVLKADEARVKAQAQSLAALSKSRGGKGDNQESVGGARGAAGGGGLNDAEAVAEKKLALTIVKSDFAKMRVVGQFNLGFILAVREAAREAARASDDAASSTAHDDDELFIIDQHASDEKYNFERLQASTVVQSQRLVQPKRLELTAVEEEIVRENRPALAANGFLVDLVEDGSEPVGSRCRLRTLPLSRETTFDLADLEELIALLGEAAGTGLLSDEDEAGLAGLSAAQLTAVPRPAKVRKMFAMRACRSSIMVGRALSHRQMGSVLAHMGEMDKPWNCPHGRPTMRHLCSLAAAWDATGRTWDDDEINGGGSGSGRESQTDWAGFLKKRRRAAGA